MCRGEQLDVGADLAVGTDPDLSNVAGRQVVVDKAAGTEVDVLAVVDVERGLDHGALTELTEKVGQQGSGTGRIIEEGPVVGVGQPGPAVSDAGILRIVGDVEVPGEHPLPVGAGVACEVVGHGANGIGRRLRNSRLGPGE